MSYRLNVYYHATFIKERHISLSLITYFMFVFLALKFLATWLMNAINNFLPYSLISRLMTVFEPNTEGFLKWQLKMTCDSYLSMKNENSSAFVAGTTTLQFLCNLVGFN